MNLIESHNWVIIRLTVISILLSVIAYLIDHYNWVETINPFYTISIWSVVIMNCIALFVFMILKPKVDLKEEEYKESNKLGKLSRNIYMFSVLMFFTGLMTFSSSAGRVSYLFFLLGLVTMPVAHVLYGIWIKKISSSI